MSDQPYQPRELLIAAIAVPTLAKRLFTGR